MWRRAKDACRDWLGRRIAAWCLIGGGLLGAGVVVWMLRADIQNRMKSPTFWDEYYAEQAEQAQAARDWRMALVLRQRAIEAANTIERRARTGTDMVGFLIDDDNSLYPDQTRWLMAREYLLSLVHHEADADTLWRLWGYAARVSAVLQDQALWSLAAGIRERIPPESEPPFSILLDEWDARLVLGDPFELLSNWNYMASVARTEQEKEQSRLRLARLLDDLLGHAEEDVYEAHVMEIPDQYEAREKRLERLTSLINGLEESRTPVIRSEAQWLRARLAARLNDPEGEIEALYASLKGADSRLSRLAYVRLLDRLREADQHAEADSLIGGMLRIPELSAKAVKALQQRLQDPLDRDTLNSLLQLVEVFLSIPSGNRPRPDELLIHAAHAAAAHGRYDVADRYASAASGYVTDRRSAADLALFRAELADHRRDGDAVLRHAAAVMSSYPGHPREAEARFLWIQYVARIPFAEADLLSAITASLIRAPREPRTLEWMLAAASRLEAHGLYGIAESYYRQAVLLGSWQFSEIGRGQALEAVLGQARVLSRMGKDLEADQLLRTVSHSHGRVSGEIRAQAGMLWAASALRNRQYREAARRWRVSVGAPGDPLVVQLFALLMPDLPDIEFPPGPRARMPAGDIPTELVLAAADEAVELLLNAGDFTALDHLFNLIEADPVRRTELPLSQYRARTLARMVAEESPDMLANWLSRQGVEASEEQRAAGLRSAEDLTPWVEATARASTRIREAVY